eukprot:12714660-Alexandrium_andersonii.AAC.1
MRCLWCSDAGSGHLRSPQGPPWPSRSSASSRPSACPLTASTSAPPCCGPSGGPRTSSCRRGRRREKGCHQARSHPFWRPCSWQSGNLAQGPRSPRR